MKYIWNSYLYCGCRWKWRVIIAVIFYFFMLKSDLAPNVWLLSSADRASHPFYEGHGFESCWSPDIFQASSFQLRKLEIYCNDHCSLTSTAAVQIFHIFTSFHCTGIYQLSKLTSLLMCRFTAQVVEHRTGIAEVTGSNPVEALIFFRLLPLNCLNLKKNYCDDYSSLSLLPNAFTIV